ncbi:electron transfer flavoprotein subunit beta/FixA family protein [Desulfatibacillum aliphaticivorans]|uniref:electron transfer flavoprotein subunit beta/FixA family protein n=1 Tax=Desulfatibacillum aliphaticivorans TaxID=218208 RepID=UPI00041328B2|nr:electron transfer flavoprotein subunit beta/FixA family protein [Desulfatibacillum aliphaticivorans]
MNIIVCMKQAPDPEGPRDSFCINVEDMKVEPKGIPPALSLFDENALEAALRIKDADKENVKITVLCMGKKVSSAVLLKALAAGADAAVMVQGAEYGVQDSFSTARALAAAVAKIGDYDLILCGRQASDSNAGQTGILLAYVLGIPAVSLAQKIVPDSAHALIERVLQGGYETVKAPLPCLAVVGNEAGELRYPAMKERRLAKKKPTSEWAMDDLALGGALSQKVTLKRLFAPTARTRACKFVAGDALAQVLREDQVI